MSDRKCENCMTYRKGDCAGLRLCDNYVPALVIDKETTKHWPKSMRRSYAGTDYSNYDLWPEDRKRSRPKERKKPAPLPDPNVVFKPTVKSKPKPKPELTVYERLKKKADYKQIRINNIDTVRPLLRKYGDDVIVWMTLDRVPEEKRNTFKACCLLQHKDYCITVKGKTATDRMHALLLGLRDVAVDHLRKPCDIYIITATDLFDDERYFSKKNYYLAEQSLDAFVEKGCKVKEVWLEYNNDMIKKQVKNPMLLGEDD